MQLFKEFADIDAYPICANAHTVEEIVAVGRAIAPASAASTSRTSRRRRASRSSAAYAASWTSPCSTTINTGRRSSRSPE
jgi:hypothetical protein